MSILPQGRRCSRVFVEMVLCKGVSEISDSLCARKVVKDSVSVSAIALKDARIW